MYLRLNRETYADYDLLANLLTTYRCDAALTHFGCMLSFPGSVVQP